MFIKKTYKVENLIGKGSYGEVYLSTDLKTKQKYVIKYMRKGITASI